MTCIVGIVDNGKVFMGADSAGTDYRLGITVRKDEKVFQNGDFLISFTSSFRMGQLLRYAFEPPEYRADKKDLLKYMCTDFIDAVRECFKKAGFLTIEKNEELGGCFLVGCHGRLFKIDSDFQVGESLDGCYSCGCGDFFALGSLASTKEMEATNRVRLALEVAEKYSGAVRGPFVILEAK